LTHPTDAGMLPSRGVSLYMQTTFRVSVIIPTRDRPELLRNLLESLSKQNTSDPFEVIVVNDGSGEDLSSLEVEFSDISLKVVTLEENRGRSAARNAGFRCSTGEILVFLDDDMTVVEDFISRHIQAHTEQMDAVIGDVLSAPEYASRPLARYIERQGVRKLKSRDMIPPKCFRTGNASLSRRLFEQVGMFDDSLKTYGEDLELGMKLSRHGARFVFAEGAVSYNHDPSDIDDMIAKMREYGRFTLPILARTYPDLAEALLIHLAERIQPGRDGLALTLKKIGLHVALTPPFYGIALLVYRFKFLGRLLFPVIDFIRLYNYVTAYWAAQRANKDGREVGPEQESD
jgi:glycosyltransferase involved in cell wall biosynthesis